MRYIYKFNFLILLWLFIAAFNISFADTVFLKNGGIIEGKILEEKNNKVLVSVDEGTMTFSKGEIKEIKYSQNETANNTGKETKQLKKKKNYFAFLANIKYPSFLKRLSLSNILGTKKLKEYTIFIIIGVGTIVFIILLIILQLLLKLETKDKHIVKVNPSIAQLQKEHNEKTQQATKGFSNKSFLKLLPGAFLYPLKGDGWILLLLGLITFGILKLLSFIPFAGWTIGVFAAGYMTAYLIKIINSTGEGNPTLPPWPEFTRIDSDIMQPLIRMISPFFIAFSPAIAFGLVAFFRHQFEFAVVAIALGALGGIYYPMAVLATAVGIDVHYHPFLIIKAIFKTFLSYLITIILLGIIISINTLLSKTLNLFLPMSIVFLLQGILSFYLTIVEARILGILYYTKIEKLGFANIL